MGIQRAYCSMSFLNDIIKQRKSSNPHKIAYELLNKLCDIYVDIPTADIQKLCKSDSVFNHLYRRENRSVKSYTDADSQLKEPKADDLFFFSNIDKNRANQEKAIRGLFMAVQSDMHLFERVCYNQYRPFSLVPKKHREKCVDKDFEQINSWKDIFDGISVRPINAAVITDNFMFTKHSDRKYYSLYALLAEIVPKTLEIPFHLTIFFNNNNNTLRRCDAEKVVQEIHEMNFCKDMKVSIIAHVIKDTTHDRELLTNYHYMHSGTGFSVIDSRGIQEVTKGEIKSVYHCISTIPAQTTVKHLHSQVLEWLKKIYKGERGTTSDHAYEVGDDFQNRLLVD